jgi:hypothetical protein
MTVTENTFSAQYGHTSGGFVTYTTKSGTSQFHGNLYDFFTEAQFDARNFFLPFRLPLTQNNWGFDLGGPIPKIKKWGQTFWFFNADGLDYHSIVNTGFVNTLPTPAERGGDFSELLTTTSGCSTPPCQVGTDAIGRPIYQGEIFNPATLQNVGGVPVRTGFGFNPVTGLPIAGSANVIPSTAFSNTATQVVPLIPGLDRNTLFTPNGYGGTSDDNNKINVRTYLFRIDHTFNDKFSLSFTYYQNRRPRTAHCGGPQGCNTEFNGQTESAKNDTYIGQGFYQLITNHFAHLQLNWVMKPNVFNHTTLAYDRWVMNGNQLSAGVGWNQKLGLGLPNEPVFNNAGFPQLQFNGGSIPYTHYGTSWTTGGSDINNRYQFLDDVTWIKSHHTVKAGFEFRYMNYPQTGWAQNTGGIFNFNALETGGYNGAGNNLSQTGDPFASFLLGLVDNANFVFPFEYRPSNKYTALWANDDYKVTPNLTLTLGLRFDHQSGLSEQFGRFSSFVPTLANPGAGGFPGATIFGGSIPVGNGNWAVGPRFGFAYRLGDKNVIRGGYGIYYAIAPADSWDPYPVDGYQTNPTVSNVTNGLLPAYLWNNGFPQDKITAPPQLVPSVLNGGSPVGVAANTYTMPRYQNWSFSFQRQLTQNMAIDVAYVGNHGTRLIDGRTSAGTYQNMNDSSVLNYGANVLGAFIINGVPDPVAAAAGIKSPYPGFTGDVAQALRPWPQYQGINWRYFPNGSSHYNALQVAVNQRMTHGLTFKIAYTYSQLINNGAETGLGSGGPPVQDPNNIAGLTSVSSDDVPNIFAVGWAYQLPFGRGKKFGGGASGFVDKLIGNWQLSGLQTYQQARPLSITMNNNLGGYLFNAAKFPDKDGNGYSGTFKDPNASTYLNESGWAAPGGNPNALAFGNAPRNDASVRGFHYFNEDIALIKDTYFAEGKYVRFEGDFGNIFNRVDFCPVATNWSNAAGFGTTGSQCNIPRRIQLGLQIFF